jgi:hypothetical protein
LSSSTLVSPRLADRAAPAAFCCALDFAGIVALPFRSALPPLSLSCRHLGGDGWQAVFVSWEPNALRLYRSSTGKRREGSLRRNPGHAAVVCLLPRCPMHDPCSVRASPLGIIGWLGGFAARCPYHRTASQPCETIGRLHELELTRGRHGKVTLKWTRRITPKEPPRVPHDNAWFRAC